jgi:AcrR family transcriptional regulator
MMSETRPRGPRARKVAPPALLDAAQAVFSQHGIEGATVRAIARRAGCDPALIYYHYASKEALFLALLDRRLPPLVERLGAIAARTDARGFRERLWEAFEAFQDELGEDAGFRSVFRGQLIQGSDAIKDAVAGHLQPILHALRSLLQQGIDRGELRPDLDTTTTTFFIGRMHMEILDLVPSMGQRLTGLPPKESLAAVRRAWLEFVWRAIAVNPESVHEHPSEPSIASGEQP